MNSYSHDKSLSAFNNFLQTAKQYGFDDEEGMDSTQTDDRTDIEILTDFFIELENQDVLLKKILRLCKEANFDGLSKQTNEINLITERYFKKMKELKSNLEYVVNNLQGITNSITRQTTPRTIKMDYRYHRFANMYLLETREELLKAENIFKSFEDLLSNLSSINGSDLFKKEAEFEKLREQLKESLDLVFDFNQKLEESVC